MSEESPKPAIGYYHLWEALHPSFGEDRNELGYIASDLICQSYPNLSQGMDKSLMGTHFFIQGWDILGDIRTIYWKHVSTWYWWDVQKGYNWKWRYSEEEQ